MSEQPGPDTAATEEERARRQRKRSLWILAMLVGWAVLIYALSILKMGADSGAAP